MHTELVEKPRVTALRRRSSSRRLLGLRRLSSLGLSGGGGGSRGRLLGSLSRLLRLLGSFGGSSLGLIAIGRRPQSEIVAQELHDEGAVAVRLLGERIELGDGIVKRLLGQMAGTVRRVEDLVVEDGEVQGETKTDGMRRGELGLSNIGGVLYK
jgi:hypothetical protein